ncbi:MAG: ABC transporter substrate-binding protein [Propionicimonas sp.]|uniref:ABC transporter substrate-binding protein n=1 Tax=Propionicimonas sp. TaxID=1955623 RepID=UPI002B20C3FE|nr:ABC transporter substrate-binding protein [Propionicimonas sp.]MEA4944596.1 ABC transporter substrate-binding protein [Propionicimonas sp.]
MRLLRSAIAASSVLALTLAGCSTSTPAGTGAPSESTQPATSAPAPSTSDTAAPSTGDVPKGNGELIYLVSKGFQHRFWQAVKEGAEKAGTDYNYKIQFTGPDDETKVTQQLDQLKAALDAKPIAIGFAALDTGAAEPVLAQIQAANIPMVAFDSGVDSDLPVTTVQTDNEAAAQEAAKHMIDLLGGKGTVGVICHDQTSQTGKQRCNGFVDYVKANAPDIKLLEPQVAGEVGLAANTAKAMIQANPDIAGVYGTNEAAATGAVQGVTESGKTDIKVVGFDSGKTQLEAIRDGRMAGAITQSPVKMGYETVVAAIKAVNNIEQPKIIDSGFAWYDKTNIDDPDIAANLYE